MKIGIRKILLVFTIVLVAFNAACARQKESVEKTIKGDLVICTDGNSEYINLAAEKFKIKYPMVNIKIENTSDYNIENKDVIVVKDEVAKEFIDNNEETLYVLNDEDILDLDNIKGDKLSNLEIADKQYGIPWYVTPVAIIYNKNHLKTLNINEDSINTYNDYLALGDKLPALGDVKLLSLSRGNLNKFLEILLVQGNIDVGNDATDDKTLLIGNLIRGIFTKNLSRDIGSEDEAIKSFAEGRELSLIVTPMILSKIEKSYPEIVSNMIFQKLPSFYNGSNKNIVVGGSDVFINKASQNIDAAVAFMNFISSDYENMKSLYDNNKLIPAHYYMYFSQDFSVGSGIIENNIYELFTNMAIKSSNYNFYKNYRDKEDLLSRAIIVSLDSTEELQYIIDKLEIQMWTNKK